MKNIIIECTVKNIKKLVDASKDESKETKIAIAYDLPITAGCLYKIEMERRHGIDIPI